jgi:hypothetical protein
LLAPLAAQSVQIEAISTERPSVGTTPDITPPHSFQVENGLNVIYSSKAYAADLPESLARLGIGHHLELRLSSANLVHQSDSGQGVSFLQAQDLGFSVKSGIAGQNSLLPQAIVVALSCPTGASTMTSGSYDPSTVLVWHQALRKGFTIIENLSFLRTTINGARKNDWGTGVVVGRAISGKVSWFAEYAPMFAADANALHIFDGGFIYAPQPTSQVDLRIGHQNDPAGLHNFLSLGNSFRVNGLGRRFQTELPK